MPTIEAIILRDGWCRGTHRDPDTGRVCILTAADEAAADSRQHRELLVALHAAMAHDPGARRMSDPERREPWELAGLVQAHNDNRIRSQQEALRWARRAQRSLEEARVPA